MENDSDFVCELPLSQVRLNKNAAFPWIILIPKRIDSVELIDLTVVDQEELLKEIRKTSYVMRSLFHPKKLNIANLGNYVPQFHVHVIARFEHDKAWPNPVWNSGVSLEYSLGNKQDRFHNLMGAFLDS